MSTFASLATSSSVSPDNSFVDIYVSNSINLADLLALETASDRVHLNCNTIEFRNYAGDVVNATLGLHVLNLSTTSLTFENNSSTYGNIIWLLHGQSDIGLNPLVPGGPYGPRDLYLARNLLLGDGSTTAGIYTSGDGINSTWRTDRVDFKSIDDTHSVEILLDGFNIMQLNLDFRILNGSKLVFLNSGASTLDRAGSSVLVGGTVTVSNTTVTANTIVLMSVITPGGTRGFLDYDVSEIGRAHV